MITEEIKARIAQCGIEIISLFRVSVLLTSPSSSSTSRKSKSLKTLNCCSEVVSSSVSSLVPSSDDTWLGWCSIRSRSPQDEKITCVETSAFFLNYALSSFMIQKSTICAGAWQTGRTVTLRTYRGGMRTYRWVLGEANFLSAEWQNIYQLLSCTFLGHRKKLNNDKINVYTIMFSTALRDAVVYYFIIKKTGNDTIIAKHCR